MQIKTVLRVHLTSVRMATMEDTNHSDGEDVGKKEPLDTAGGNVN
jgi:hypothetical protein